MRETEAHTVFKPRGWSPAGLTQLLVLAEQMSLVVCAAGREKRLLSIMKKQRDWTALVEVSSSTISGENVLLEKICVFGISNLEALA